MATYVVSNPELIDRVRTGMLMRQQRMQGYAARPASTAVNVRQYARTYPQLRSNVAYALGDQGVPPNSLIAQAAAARDGRFVSSDGLGYYNAGDVVTPSQIQRQGDDRWSWLRGIGERVHDAATTTTRGVIAQLAAPFEEMSRAVTSVGEAALDDDGFTMDEVARNFRDAPQPGLAAATGRGEMPGGGLVSAINPVEVAMGVRADPDDPQGGLGDGFMPGGEIYAERERRKHSLVNQGHFLTPGRVAVHGIMKMGGKELSAEVRQAGSPEYHLLTGLLDFGFNIFADPGAKAAKTAGAIKAAKARGFAGTWGNAVGLATGLRKSTLPERAARYFDTREGVKLLDYLAGESKLTNIKRIKGMPLHVADEIRQSSDPAHIRQLVDPLLGRQIAETPFGLGMDMVGRNLRRRKSYSTSIGRWMGEAYHPLVGKQKVTGHLWAGDVDGSFDNLQKFYSVAKVRPDKVEQLNRRFAQLMGRGGNDANLYEFVAGDLFPLLDNELKSHGVNALKRRHLTQMYRDAVETSRAFWINANGNHAAFPGVKTFTSVSGEPIPQPSPQVFAEYLHSGTALPDFNELRRSVANPAFQTINNFAEAHPLINFGYRAPEFFIRNVWKPLALLRAAYTVRVVGEEQVRMAGSGLDSAFSHPLSYIGWTIGGREGRVRRALARRGAGKGDIDIHGDLLGEAEEFQAAMSRGVDDWLHGGAPGTVFTGGYRPVHQREVDFLTGWSDELQLLSQDSVVREVARATAREGGIDAIKQSFWDGDMAKFRRALMTNQRKRTALSQRVPTANLPPHEAALVGSDNYIDSVLSRINQVTAGNTDLVDLLRTGKLGTIQVARNPRMPKAKIQNVLAEHILEGNAPEWSRVAENLAVPGRAGQRIQMGDMRDRAVGFFFDHLMTHRTNILSRSPTFRQKYWAKAEELAPFLDEAGHATLVDQAHKAKLGKVARRINKAGRAGEDSLDADALDTMAKGWALDETQKLLYDLSKRSLFAEASAVAFPFAEAWREVVTSWSRILAEHPQTIRRGSQAIAGLRGSNPIEIIDPGSGDADPSQGPGFFHPDDTFGEEMFVYPFKFLGKAMFGERMFPELEATAEGLNIATAGPLGVFMPGIGPAIQVPFAMMPEAWRPNLIRDLVEPYGTNDAFERGDLLGGIAETLAPAWVRHTVKAFSRDPVNDINMANLTGDVYQAMVMNGELAIPQSDQDIEAGLRRAGTWARMLQIVRGLAAGALPSAPIVDWRVTDLNRQVYELDAAVEMYRNLADDQGYTAATTDFVNLFGPEARWLTTPKSKMIRPDPIMEPGDEWAQRNQHLFDNYRDVAGWFAPEGGAFSSTAYEASLRSGARERLTASQRVRLGNYYLAQAAYDNAKRLALETYDTLTSNEAEAYLAEVRASLMERFPGYTGSGSAQAIGAGTPQRPDILMGQLRGAVNDPALAGNRVAEASAHMLAVHDAAVAAAQSDFDGLKTYVNSKDTEYLREWVREQGEALSLEVPQFASIYRRVFESTMNSAEENFRADANRNFIEVGN